MRIRLGLISMAVLGVAVSGCATDTGLAELNCGVAASGLLSDCRVVRESPAGQGYGMAAARTAEGTSLSEATMRNPPASGRITSEVRGVARPAG